ncbi:MAG: hypothetical protein PHQ27_05565 [Victivallales bacterium]|nr:hypothetical protein [Victivallales bacterium]
MKKLVMAVCCAASLLVIAGCSTIRATNSFNENKQTLSATGESVAHVNGTINGFYVLWYIPLWCGDDKDPGTPVFFTNNVKVSSTVGMVSKYAADQGATKLLDLQSSYRVSPGVPFFNWLFAVKECQVSANAVK